MPIKDIFILLRFHPDKCKSRAKHGAYCLSVWEWISLTILLEVAIVRASKMTSAFCLTKPATHSLWKTSYSVLNVTMRTLFHSIENHLYAKRVTVILLERCIAVDFTANMLRQESNKLFYCRRLYLSLFFVRASRLSYRLQAKLFEQITSIGCGLFLCKKITLLHIVITKSNKRYFIRIFEKISAIFSKAPLH